MKRYEVEVIVTVLLGDESDEESAYEAVAEFMSDAHSALSTGHPQTWNMLEGCAAQVPTQRRVMAR